jgi:16S rRNA (cytosine967-C5)-methyltransferase
VLKRNPDIKWRQTQEEIDELNLIQKKVLADYAPFVQKGGFLTYAVCTFRKAETIEVVDHFLTQNSEFELHSQGYFGPGESDGFFMAALKRKMT